MKFGRNWSDLCKKHQRDTVICLNPKWALVEHGHKNLVAAVFFIWLNDWFFYTTNTWPCKSSCNHASHKKSRNSNIKTTQLEHRYVVLCILQVLIIKFHIGLHGCVKGTWSCSSSTHPKYWWNTLMYLNCSARLIFVSPTCNLHYQEHGFV